MPDNPGVCRICECTDDDACADGCGWAEPDLCDVCALFKAALAEMILDHLVTSGPVRIRETRAALMGGEEVPTKEKMAEVLLQPTERVLDEMLADVLESKLPEYPLIVVPR